MPAKWTAARHADVKALVNIESSFYKLVGGRKLGALDPAFLRLVVHIAFGTSTKRLCAGPAVGFKHPSKNFRSHL